MNTEKRILVIDDDASITRLLKLNLEQINGYSVRTLNDATQAMATATEFRPDLILLDVLMPGVDGGELAREFQANPQFNKVPIIFLTAVTTKQEVSSRGGLIGGMPFLAKPVDIPEVVSCLEAYLGT